MQEYADQATCAVTSEGRRADLNTSINVTVQPIDLHTSIAAHQDPYKCASEDAIAVEVPVIAEPNAASAYQAVPEASQQQMQ